MSAGKVKNQPQPKPRPGDVDVKLPPAKMARLREAMRMEGDPDVAVLQLHRDAQANKIQSTGIGVAAAKIANNYVASKDDLKADNGVAHRKAITVNPPTTAGRLDRNRVAGSAVLRRSRSRSLQLKRVGDSKRVAILNPRTLKRQAIKSPAAMREIKVGSLKQSVDRNMNVQLPSFDRVVLGSQGMVRAAITLSKVSMSEGILSAAVQKEAVRKSAMSGEVLRSAKAQSVLRGSIMRAQHRMAKLGAVAVKVGMRKQVLRAEVLSRGSKQQSSTKRSAGVHQNIFVIPQQAQLLAVLRGQRSMSRSRASGETASSAQRVSGKAKQSTSMVLGFAAQQTQGMMQTKAAAPFLAARSPSMAGLRSPGIINPMLACPVPVMQEQNGRILSPDAWIDGSLYSLINHIDPEIADAFFECLLKQLQKGPASLAKNTLRQKANKCLKKGVPAINAITWAAMLQEVLLQSMHHVKIFDDSGIRGSAAVRADSAMLLDIDDELFAAWEDSFCMNAIAWNLSVDNKASVEERLPKHKDVMLSVEQQVITRSSEAFAKDDYQSALLHTFETKVQWKAARCSALEGGEEKVAASLDLIIELAKKDRPAAARMMTIIVRHSSINKRKMARDIFVPRWSVDDLRCLIIKLTKEHVGVVSDNYFRSQLTAWENSSLNDLILNANHENAKARMKKLSPKQPIQDFVELLEKYGQDDEVLHDIWEDIARNFSKMN